MPNLQEQKSAIYKDVLYAEFAGAKIGDIQDVLYTDLARAKNGYIQDVLYTDFARAKNRPYYFQTTSYYMPQSPFRRLALSV